MNWKTMKVRSLSLLLAGVLTLGMAPAASAADAVPLKSGLLTEPFLQLPEENSVHVVWFTESETQPAVNQVWLYENGADQAPTRKINAETTTLSPIAPTLAQLPNAASDEPYLMSNTVTEFSILDTGTGKVDSYYYDTTKPGSDVVKFDSFDIQKNPAASLEENDVLSHLGSYAAGESDQNGGVAEIVAYNTDNEKFYTVNGKTKTVDIVSIAGLTADGADQTMTLDRRIDVSGMIEGFPFGDVTSVAVDTIHDRIAVAAQAEGYADPGAVLILDYDGRYLAHYRTGVQPDMVTFTPDGRYVLTADEGEPRQGCGQGAVDPKGSVTIVDLDAARPAGNEIDAVKDKKIDIRGENLMGVYMPDGISVYEITDGGLTQVYDSGSDFERVTAAAKSIFWI